MNEAPHTTVSPETAPGQALQIRRLLSSPGTHPFESVEWELRDAHIGHGDHVAFEQRDVEFPKSWSQNATNIVSQKYFRGQLGSPAREHSVKQMISRVAGTITGWGRARRLLRERRGRDRLQPRAHLHPAAPDGRLQLAGLVQRRLRGDAAVQRLLHPLRRGHDGVDPRLEHQGGHHLPRRLRLGHQPLEHPRLDGAAGQGRHRLGARVSFMRGADSWAGTIKSGGKTRRAAKMVVLDVDHPDIREFIWCKAKEEDKAAALRDAGFDMSIDGDGFISIQYQNANNSVRITDEFMKAVEDDDDWHLIARTTGEPVGEPMPARELMQEIAEAAWRCADPGVQYDTTINQWHTCPVSGRINASNPCSEYMHVDDSACNLASLNLMKFRRPDGTLDVETFEHAVDIVLLAQEIVVGPSSYPTRGDRRQRPRLPPARPRLRQPRRLPDEQRHALRLRRRAAAPPRRSPR